jgi:hypothetical protein
MGVVLPYTSPTSSWYFFSTLSPHSPWATLPRRSAPWRSLRLFSSLPVLPLFLAIPANLASATHLSAHDVAASLARASGLPSIPVLRRVDPCSLRLRTIFYWPTRCLSRQCCCGVETTNGSRFILSVHTRSRFRPLAFWLPQASSLIPHTLLPCRRCLDVPLLPMPFSPVVLFYRFVSVQ